LGGPGTGSHSVGAPAAAAASAMTCAAWQLHLHADGCGLNTMGLRAFRLMRLLYITVEVGLVDGTSATMTPTGSAISATLRDGSRRMMPTVLRSRIASYTRSEAKRFFVILSSYTPKPVSSTASFARARALARPASAMFIMIRSTCSWVSEPSLARASAARRTASLAS